MAPIPCPACRQPMQSYAFERRDLGRVDLDLCFCCQGIWFDRFESAQITPGGIIELFKLIHTHRDQPRQPLPDALQCPRCDERLLHGIDLAKSGRFNYYRCLQQHGRFTVFSQFMIEKGFVRQLTGAEVEQLRARVQVVRCTGCGAPVDISHDSVCGHCRAPLAILDPEAVEKALASYRRAEEKRTRIDPEKFADALLLGERDRRELLRDDPVRGSDLGGLVIAGAEVIWNLLGS